MLRYPKNKESGEFDYTRAPTLRLKVPFWEGEWKVEIYDMEQNQLWPSDNLDSPLELIPKLTRVACVIQCGGIWFAGGKFGVTWKVFQAVAKPPQSLRGKCHIRLTDSDKDRMTSSGAQSTPTGSDAQSDNDNDNDNVGVSVQDSDDEAEQSNDPPPTPAVENVSPVQPPPVKKTIVRKKKSTADEE
jgi:hypothetical protein